LVIGDLAHLREPIHAPSDFHIDMAIVDKGMQLIVVHDVRQEDYHWDAHVSIVGRLHGGSNVEIFAITHPASGTRGGNDAAEKQFGGGEVSGFSADIAGIFNMVAANGPSHTMWDGFFRLVCTDNAEVGGMTPLRNG